MKVHTKSRAYHVKNRGYKLGEGISDLEESGKALRGGFHDHEGWPIITGCGGMKGIIATKIA